MDEKIKNDCEKALNCLYIAVEEFIADDVNQKVKAHLRQVFQAGADAMKTENETKIKQLSIPYNQNESHISEQDAYNEALIDVIKAIKSCKVEIK